MKLSKLQIMKMNKNWRNFRLEDVENIDEKSKASKEAEEQGLVHLGFGRYGPNKGDSATHVSMGGALKKLSGKKKSKKSDDKPQMEPGQPSGDKPQMGLKPFKTKATKIGGGTGVDADFLGEPPEGSREPDDTAGDPEDAWDDEEGRAKPTGKTDADAWEDDPVGGDDVDDEEPEDDEPEKPEREPVKVKYDTGSQDKGNVWKGASGRFAAAHGYSGEKTGFDDPMAATAWASGLYDTPEDAIASIYEAKKEIIKVINGKKYKPIKESVNKRIAVKEVYKWLKGLEEYRYRKIPNVDVRRITSFVNNGLSEIDLPKSLQKKWESAKYSKEKNLADRFVKQKISQKLTQTESKHPLKEQYDRLFTDRTVL